MQEEAKPTLEAIPEADITPSMEPNPNGEDTKDGPAIEETWSVEGLHNAEENEPVDILHAEVAPEINLGSNCQGPRRSGRSTKEPLWLKDYLTKKTTHGMILYPLSIFLTCNIL